MKKGAMGNDASFGQWLKQRRKALDLTQVALAKQVGCAVSTLQKMEAGQRRPSKKMAARLAEHLAIAPELREEFVRFARSDSGNRLQSRARNGIFFQPARPNNLPARLTRLVGRNHDLAVLQHRLNTGARLLTLVGPPGIGKTRLSIELASTVLDQFEDGAYFVSIAQVSDPALVIPTIAETLQVKDVDDRPLDWRLNRYLRDKHMLLVLDNFEQVLAAAANVVQMLEACPWLTVLVTSRESLQVRGERQFPVVPLALPGTAAHNLPSPAGLLEHSAIELFVDRAQAVDPSFTLDQENARYVVAICDHLDGLPLAVELIAARAKVWSPLAMLTELERGWLLGIEGPRNLEPRHKTLRRAIRWSYDLLSPAERRMFTRLGVFVGGFTLDAVGQVAAGYALLTGGDESTVSAQRSAIETEAVSGITSLLDKSLLWRMADEGGLPRFAMLETIRAYALERLALTGEDQDLRRRHAAYFVQLAKDAEAHLCSHHQLSWLARLDAEQDNLRVALDWCLLDDGDGSQALSLVSSLGWFWFRRNHYAEGARWIEKALLRGVDAPEPLKAKTLAFGALLAVGLSDLERGLAWGEEGLALARLVHDERLTSLACGVLSELARVKGDPLRAFKRNQQGLECALQCGDVWLMAAHLNDLVSRQEDPARELIQAREALALARQSGDRWLTSSVLRTVGSIAWRQGQAKQALALFEESADLARELQDTRQLMFSLSGLGTLTLRLGDAASSETYFEECLELGKQAGTVELIAIALLDLGQAAHRQGDLRKAAERLNEGLALAHEAGVGRVTADLLAGLASVAAAAGQTLRSARLFGAADALYEAEGERRHSNRASDYEREVFLARKTQKEATLAAAWADGRKISLDEAVAFAMAGATGSFHEYEVKSRKFDGL